MMSPPVGGYFADLPTLILRGAPLGPLYDVPQPIFPLRRMRASEDFAARHGWSRGGLPLLEVASQFHHAEISILF